jgi:DNA-binding SARP family transcriptional activator/tetratricopeptide (TPR) repeat protein
LRWVLTEAASIEMTVPAGRDESVTRDTRNGSPGIEPTSIRRISLLGHPEVSFGGQTLRFGIKKALALLCYLAAEGGSHPRRELAELLWPQSDERHARTALRSALAHLRKTLKENRTPDQGEIQENRFLLADGDLLGVQPRGIDLDLRALESAVELARSEASGTPPGGGGVDDAVGRRDLIAHLEETLGVYRGEFMEGFSLEDAPEFELWVEAQRTRGRALFGELCEKLSRLEREERLVGEAIGTARLWTRHAPLEEAAQRRLMELLSGVGESERALLAYEGFRNALKRDLQMEPSSRMREHAASLREEVEERAYLGASFVRSGATPTISSQLSALEVPLVGREEEFGTLLSEYQAARQGASRVVAVLGEAGIGKTRLAQEVVIWARSREADVLEGRASEGAGGLPYGPLVEALRPRMERERAPDDLLEDTWLAELSRLLPELKDRYPDLPLPTSSTGGETAKGALFEAIARLVEALASRAPVVLFLDDLQWSDIATLEVLEYAGRHWAERGASVLMLIAARPEDTEVSSAFQRSLSSLGRRLPVRSLTLGRLAKEDVERLLLRLATRASSPSKPTGASEVVEGSNIAESGLKRLGERLASETEGQPFYLVEMLKVLLEEGMLLMRSRAGGETVVEVGPAWRTEKSTLSGMLPKSVREVIRSRLTRLSPDAAELLRAGTVLKRGFGFETVVGVAGLGETQGLRALEELIERRLLLEEAGGGEEEEEPLLYTEATYYFSHEMIRQVAYTEVGRARRRVLHRRAFEILEERGGPSAELGRHALAGGLGKEAFAYSVAAGDRAMEVFAVRDAIEHYERARNLLAEEVRTGGTGQPFEPSISDLEHLYTQLGLAYELPKEWEKAQAAYETMRVLGRQLGEARLEVISLNLLAILTFHQQDTGPPTVRRLLEEARRVAEETGLEEALVETECNLADVMSYWTGEHEHSAPLARKTLASARALEEERPDLIARALWTLARLELIWGSLEESAAYAEEGAALSRELVKRRPPRMFLSSMGPAATGFLSSWRAGTKALEIQCLRILAYDRILQGRPGEGIQIAREVLGMSRGLHERAEALGSFVLGLGLSEIGEYEEALELCRRGTELARKLPNPFLLWLNLDHLGWVYEAMLAFEEARKIHEEALNLRGALGSQCERSSSIRLCAVAALSESWEDAYAHAKRAHQSRTSLDVLGSLSLHYEVEALLRGGDERSAREEARQLTERAEANERERVAYQRSLAVLSEFEGDTQRAIEHLLEALTLAEKIGLPGELWQIQSKIGELHERGGEAEQAREAFSRAAQNLKMLAQKIEDEELREGFLSAPRVRRVLGRN